MSILKQARKGDTIRASDPLGYGSPREYLIGHMECTLDGPLDDGSDILAYCINPTYDERYPSEYVLSESVLSEKVQRGCVVDLLAEEVTS